MNKIILGIVIIIAIVAAFFIFSAGRVGYQTNEIAAPTGDLPDVPNPPTIGTLTGEMPVTQNEFFVRYTSQGFVPANISIAPGQAIVFRNETSSGMWIASNPHPTHGLYPELNQGRTVGQGESWTLNFDRVGAFGYHNHIKPSQSGIVTVR